MRIQAAALFLGGFTLVAARCPMGAVQGPSARDCYIYVNEVALWLSAEERCILKGGHLASISGALVNSFLAVPAAKNCSAEYWIGGAWNLEVPNTWVWTDGRPFRYTHWAQGQPAQTDNAQCLGFDARTNLWYGNACNVYRPYICRVPAITSGDPYEAATTSKECSCSTFPPQTPTTAAPAECATVKEECTCPTTSRWSFWTCPTASTFVTEEPSTSTGETAVHLTSTSTETTQAYPLSTTSALSETTSSSSECPPRWTYGPWSHKCYFGQSQNTWANWTWADSFCKGIGSELVSIHSVMENFWLSAFLASSNSNYEVAIGLYQDDLSQWKWSDGSSFEYANWNPNTQCSNAAYASLTTTFDTSAYPSMYWNCDQNTSTFGYFICQKDAESGGVPTEPTLPTPPPQEGSCHSGWTYAPWSLKCYYTYSPNEYQNWTWYHSFCKGLGAELISIHSEFENLWFTGFRNIIGNGYNINNANIPTGLYKSLRGWQWSDGSPFNYSHLTADCDISTPYGSLGSAWDRSSLPSAYWACNDDTDTFSAVMCQKDVV